MLRLRCGRPAPALTILVGLAAGGVLARGAPTSEPTGEVPSDWVQVSHPAMPIRFALPAETRFWVAPRIRGADAARLSALHREIHSARSAERFLSLVFYSDRPHVTLREGDLLGVGNGAARRVFVDWRTLVGTPHERRLGAEAVVLPVHPAAVLVVLGRFEESATPEERETLFPRIVRSVRVQGELEL